MSSNVLDVLLWPFKHNFLNIFVEYIMVLMRGSRKFCQSGPTLTTFVFFLFFCCFFLFFFLGGGVRVVFL